MLKLRRKPERKSGLLRPSSTNRPIHRRILVEKRAPLAILIVAGLMSPIAVWAYRTFLRNK
jgi:hypothetical protein